MRRSKHRACSAVLTYKHKNAWLSLEYVFCVQAVAALRHVSLLWWEAWKTRPWSASLWWRHAWPPSWGWSPWEPWGWHPWPHLQNKKPRLTKATSIPYKPSNMFGCMHIPKMQIAVAFPLASNFAIRSKHLLPCSRTQPCRLSSTITNYTVRSTRANYTLHQCLDKQKHA